MRRELGSGVSMLEGRVGGAVADHRRGTASRRWALERRRRRSARVARKLLQRPEGHLGEPRGDGGRLLVLCPLDALCVAAGRSGAAYAIRRARRGAKVGREHILSARSGDGGEADALARLHRDHADENSDHARRKVRLRAYREEGCG